MSSNLTLTLGLSALGLLGSAALFSYLQSRDTAKPESTPVPKDTEKSETSNPKNVAVKASVPPSTDQGTRMSTAPAADAQGTSLLVATRNQINLAKRIQRLREHPLKIMDTDLDASDWKSVLDRADRRSERWLSSCRDKLSAEERETFGTIMAALDGVQPADPSKSQPDVSLRGLGSLITLQGARQYHKPKGVSPDETREEADARELEQRKEDLESIREYFGSTASGSPGSRTQGWISQPLSDLFNSKKTATVAAAYDAMRIINLVNSFPGSSPLRKHHANELASHWRAATGLIGKEGEYYEGDDGVLKWKWKGSERLENVETAVHYLASQILAQENAKVEEAKARQFSKARATTPGEPGVESRY